MNKVSRLLTVVLASLAVGAVCGVLFAPEEGSEMRKKIGKRSKRLAGLVGDTIDDGRDSLEDIKDILQKQLHKVNERLEKQRL